MKSFITGIEGFVGGYLTEFLTSKGIEVYGIHYAPAKGLDATLYECDIRDYERLLECVDKIRPDWVFHLAAISSVGISYKQPSLTFQVNALGTFNLLQALRELSLNPRILLISSCEVYGARGEERLKENLLPSPITPYGLSKLCAEEVGLFFYKVYKSKVIIIRPFNHTGPGQQEIFIFPYVAKEIVEIERGKRKQIIEVGNIDVKRDFTDVRDIVKAYYLAIQSCNPGEIYNITSENTISIKEGIDILISQTKADVKIERTPERMRANEIPVLRGNGEKFFKTTGWRPEISFDKTLKDLLEYYRKP